jgi:hypothetical protein
MLCIPVAAQGASGFQLALQDDPVFLGRNPAMTQQQGLQFANDVGAKSLRFNLPWAWMYDGDPHSKKAPSNPQYRLADFDAAIEAASQAGIAVQLTLSGPAPAWASGDKKVSYSRPSASRYAKYVAYVAKHYKGKIRAISVWNEPNFSSTFGPVPKCKKVKGKKKCSADKRGSAYRTLYRAAYSAIKKASPKTQVWLGELSPQGRNTSKGYSLPPLEFLRSVLCLDKKAKKRSCSGIKADAVAIHPYLLGKSPNSKPPLADDLSMAVISRASSLLSKAEKLKAIRLPNGKSGVPIQLTEFGYLMLSKTRTVTEAQQSKYIAQAIKLAKKASRVKQLVLYQVVDDKPPAPWIGGLFTASGEPRTVVDTLKDLHG